MQTTKRSTKVSIFDYLNNSIIKDRTAIYFHNEVITYTELVNDILSIASLLQKIIDVKDKCISLCLPNIPNAVVAFYAINKLGGKVNLIHYLLPCKSISEIIKKTNTEAIFILDEKADLLIEECPDLNVQIIKCDFSDYDHRKLLMRPFVNQFNKIHNYTLDTDIINKNSEINTFADSVYLNSGGTTGESKIVKLSSFAFNELAYKTSYAVFDEHEYAPLGTNVLLALPLFHGFGLGVVMHTTLSHGGSVLLIDKFNPDIIASSMSKTKCNVIHGVPTLLDKLLKNENFINCALKYVEKCYLGGDLLNKKQREYFDNMLSKYSKAQCVFEGYGLTEMVTVTSVSTSKGRVGSVGRPLCGIEYMICDENYSKLPPYSTGELYISGSTMMNGYYNDEKSSKETTYIDENNKKWIKTGDIAYLDKDGYMYYVERLKRVVKISGVNVFPSEVERLVLELSYVDNSVVIEQNKNGKNYLALYIKVKNNDDLSQLQIDEIFNKLKSNLIKYSIPKEIYKITEMPLTKVGKVNYKEIPNSNVVLLYSNN